MNTPIFNQAPHLCGTCENLFDCSWKDCVKPDYAKFISEPFDKVGVTKRYRFTTNEKCYECKYYTKNTTASRVKPPVTDYAFELPQGKHFKRAVVAIRDGEIVETFESITDAAAFMGISTGNISTCLAGGSKTACGYEWRYAESEVE